MKFLRKTWPHVLVLLILVAGAELWIRHNAILDWVAMRGYHPSSAVQQLASDTTMTPYAERLFYVNRPVIETRTAFNQHCTDPSEQVAVLGCFTGDRQGIYIYQVTDPRLHGIEQVTAAHEMLHQAYARLDKFEKAKIDKLLQDYYDNQASQQLKDTIDSYKSSEPTQLVNEMHSIFGTEADNLPPALENYYKQYFTNRAAIVAYYHSYQSEFDKRLNQIHDYDNQLTQMKSQIETDKNDLQAREQALQQQKAQLDAYLAANQISQYNAAVPDYNNQVVAYRDVLNQTNSLIDQYNTVLAARNALAIQETQLEQAIDSHVATQTKRQ